MVQNSTTSYVCATAHTAGTFNTDYTAGKWVILGAGTPSAASGISSSAYGNLASTNVQAALQELDDEKAALAGSSSQVFSVADATDDAHAASAGQVQKDSLRTATAGGSSDAITATIASGLTTLTDKMAVRVKATAANTTTAPTFELTLGATSTTAKTIKKGTAGALVAGDIYGPGHMLELVWDESGDCWLLQNPAYPVGQSTSTLDVDGSNNVGIAFSVGSGALTASLKTGSGGSPTSSDPVRVAMRSATTSAGTYATRSATSAVTLTVPSSATLGHQDAVEGVLHWYVIDYASGTLELAVSATYYGHSGIVSTTAISSGSTSLSAMYSTSARTGVPYRWIATTHDSQTTAGTWANLPTITRTGWPTYLGLPRVVTKSVAGSSNVTLTQDEARCDILILTGALTGNISVIVDKTVWRWASVVNGTSGAYTLTVKVSGGTGVAITQGKSKSLYCDGTDVEDAATDVAVTSVTDSTFTVVDNSDVTKALAFQVSGVTTGTTRTVTVPDASGTMQLVDTNYQFRNRFANGDFSVDQVNEGTAYTFSASTGHALDCVRASAAGAGTFTVQRVADPDNANLYALKVACTVADASIGSTDLYYVAFTVEGYDVADMNAGLASAATITISFKMKMDVAGTYGVSVANAAANRSYIGTVTQNVASTEESKTVTLTLDTTGTWQNTNGTGLRVRFCLAGGSTYQGSAGAWAGSDLFTTSGQANFMSANTNVGYIKQFQVEKGSSAGTFDWRPVDERYRRLKHYYRKSFEVGTAVAQNAGEGGSIEYKAQIAGTTAGFELVVPFDVPMRTSPTITTYSPSAASAVWYNRNGGAASGTPTTLGRYHSVLLINPQAAGDNAGDRIQIHYSADARMT